MKRLIVTVTVVFFLSSISAFAMDHKDAGKAAKNAKLAESVGTTQVSAAGQLIYNGDEATKLNPVATYEVDGTLAKKENGETLPATEAMKTMVEVEKVLADQAFVLANTTDQNFLTQDFINILKINSDAKFSLLDAGLQKKLGNGSSAVGKIDARLALLEKGVNARLTMPMALDIPFTTDELETHGLVFREGMVFAKYQLGKTEARRAGGKYIYVVLIPDSNNVGNNFVMCSRGFTRGHDEIMTFNSNTAKWNLQVALQEVTVSMDVNSLGIAGYSKSKLNLIKNMFKFQRNQQAVTQTAAADQRARE